MHIGPALTIDHHALTLYRPSESTFLSSSPQFLKEHCCLVGPQASPICHFGKSDVGEDDGGGGDDDGDDEC